MTTTADAGRKTDRSTRHAQEALPAALPKTYATDLGEYYTPDWLAEHVLNEVGYTGDPDKRVLDPACGSGHVPGHGD